MTENTSSSEITPLSGEQLNDLVTSFDASQSNRLAMNAVTAAGIDKVALNYDRSRLLQRRFSVTVDNGEVTHQDRSGRCWLFSSLNVARFVAKKNLGVKEFEFSQNYAMYFDKLERVNYFLQDVAALVRAGEPSDSRLIQHLLADVMGDGGQWTMALNVYKKYGAVPKDLFPETESSKNTGAMNTQLRHLLHTAVAHMYADPASIDDEVAKTVAAGHRILTIHLGEPPKSFDWSGPTARACSTATAKSRPSSSGRSTWAPPTLRITCASWTIRAASTPRARRSASSTWATWPAATRPST